MNNEWEVLINIFEKHEANSDFVAECVYAYLSENVPDEKFTDDLIGFIQMVSQ